MQYAKEPTEDENQVSPTLAALARGQPVLPLPLPVSTDNTENKELR